MITRLLLTEPVILPMSVIHIMLAYLGSTVAGWEFHKGDELLRYRPRCGATENASTENASTNL